MNDLISRQAAIEIIQSMYPGMPRVPWMRKAWQKRYEPYIRTENAIRELPSAQPEQRWIPCSERLPEEGMNCLVCDKGSVAIDTFIGQGNPYNWKWYVRDYEAWMPLPEPWRGEEP